MYKAEVCKWWTARVGVQAEGLELESAGGAVQLVRTAAPTGGGLLELEEALLLQARTGSTCAWGPVHKHRLERPFKED